MLAEFFHENATKLLILGVFLLLVIFAHHAYAHNEKEAFASYCLSKSGEAFAAFLGLVTGRALAGGKNGNGNVAVNNTTTEEKK